MYLLAFNSLKTFFSISVQKQVPSTRYKPQKETDYLDEKLPSKLVMLLDNKSLRETVTKMAVCLFFWDFAGQVCKMENAYFFDRTS